MDTEQELRLLVTIGRQIPSAKHWGYEAGALLLVDWDAKEIVRELTYVSPEERRAPEGHMLFVHGHLTAGRLVVPTSTEVLFVDLERWQVANAVSLPIFNDLHHAIVVDDSLYVCNTGLQAVHRMTLAGEVSETFSASDCPTWDVYDPSADYRRTSTKPHCVHPNYLFVAAGAIWVTRFEQRDAAQIGNLQKRLPVEVGNPHDGVPAGDLVYFTTTNGFVVCIDPATGDTVRRVDLNAVDSRNCQLGWCRGIEPIDSRRALVGFSSFRPTRWKNMAHWVLDDGKYTLPSRIALYDLEAGRLLDEMTFRGEWEGASIYSILRHP
jgi:hypothetical protein